MRRYYLRQRLKSGNWHVFLKQDVTRCTGMAGKWGFMDWRVYYYRVKTLKYYNRQIGNDFNKMPEKQALMTELVK